MALTQPAVWMGAVAAALVGSELALRAILRRSPYRVFAPFYRRDLHLHRPTHPQLEAVVRLRVNADGERGDECPRGADVHRILLVGGSTVESPMNDQPTSWGGRLQALVSERRRARGQGGPVHVGNVGRAGFIVRDVAHVLRRIVPGYRRLADVAIMVGPGDMLRWLEAGAPAAAPGPLHVGGVFAEHPERPWTWTPRGLALVELLRRARTRVLRPTEVKADAAQWMGRARALRAAAARVIDEVPPAAAMIEAFEAGLDEAVRTAKATGARVVLIRQPRWVKERFTPDEEALLWNGANANVFRGVEPTAYYSTRVMYALLDELDACMRRVAERHGARFVDPLPAIPMTAESFYDHFHLTPAGSEALARAVAEAFVD